MSFYALSISGISAMETVMLRHAYRAGLNRESMPAAVANHSTIASLIPVAFFLLSIPIAFINPVAGMVTWAFAIPTQIVHTHFADDDVAHYFD